MKLFVDYNGKISKFNAATGAFIGSIGKLAASTGTCPASGAAPGWCTGGTFDVGANDGMFQWTTGDVAVDSANDFIYVSDSGNNRIAKIRLSTGAFVGAIGNLNASSGSCPSTGAATTWCTGGTFNFGWGEGMFDWPVGMARDANGFLYTNDQISGRLVRVSN